MSDRCSVIIPTLNRRDRLLRTLATIRAQHYDDLEIVVSDDGSADGTAEAVSELHDDRIVVVRHHESSGAANARNRGVKASSGRYVAFCDDDDLWMPDKVAGQLRVMEEEKGQWSFCYSVLVDDELRYHSRDRGRPLNGFDHMILVGNQVPGGCSSVIVERALLDEVGLFDPSLSMFADWELWIRLAKECGPVVWQAAGLLYVLHEGQMSMNTTTAGHELARVRETHMSRMVEQAAWSPEDGYDPLESWILRQLWLSGRWARAATYFRRNPTLLTVRRDAHVTARLVAERLLALREVKLLPDEQLALDTVHEIVAEPTPQSL